MSSASALPLHGTAEHMEAAMHREGTEQMSSEWIQFLSPESFTECQKPHFCFP